MMGRWLNPAHKITKSNLGVTNPMHSRQQYLITRPTLLTAHLLFNISPC